MGDDAKVLINGKEQPGITFVGMDLASGESMTATHTLLYEMDGSVSATSGKPHVVKGTFSASGTFKGFFDPATVAKAFGGAMYRYGDVVTTKWGSKLMVLRRVSGFNMRRPDEWECLALDADIDPANRIGHWKEDEIE